MNLDSNKETFGEKVRKYRERKKISLRGLARAGGISAVFLMDIERGKLGAPKKEVLEKMVRELELNEEEKNEFYDLAARTKREDIIPGDIKEVYIKRPKMALLLRTIGKKNLSNGIIERIIKDIENGKYEDESGNKKGR